MNYLKCPTNASCFKCSLPIPHSLVPSHTHVYILSFFLSLSLALLLGRRPHKVRAGEAWGFSPSRGLRNKLLSIVGLAWSRCLNNLRGEGGSVCLKALNPHPPAFFFPRRPSNLTPNHCIPPMRPTPTPNPIILLINTHTLSPPLAPTPWHPHAPFSIKIKVFLRSSVRAYHSERP